ncbi:ribonuclease [Leeia sp. TBRC 13508]|uniref:Ribonuclease n=1 Tax=Leeia speluncae TaxID=2884804 RepID=A0ABS8D902_9NEIS|nr:ribonuclease [Leeia speluncae]MCB6184696.1 ribonuclease [Leeia speluncae]
MKPKLQKTLISLFISSACFITPFSSMAAGTPGQFDSYLLALSWSPDYCASRPDDVQQCSKGLGFVLHGLWPQYQNGYPSNCSNERLDPAAERQYADIYPSKKLVRHEWDKHGTCAGLSQASYFTLSDKLKRSIRIPKEFVRPSSPFRMTVAGLSNAFVKENAHLTASSIVVSCSGGGRFLQEVRVCFDKAGSKAVACSPSSQKQAARSCAQPDFLVRNIK